jgi:AraC-like DNA-binding protein
LQKAHTFAPCGAERAGCGGRVWIGGSGLRSGLCSLTLVRLVASKAFTLSPPRFSPAVVIDTSPAAATSFPLLFHHQQAVEDRNPQALAERLARHYTLADFAPRLGFERQFLHRTSTAAAGDLLLTCGYTTPVQGTIGESAGIAAINLCFAGSSQYQVDGLTLEIGPERPLYFAPGHEYRYITDHYNGAVFQVDLARLQATAAAIAGLGVSQRRFACDLEAPRTVALHERRSASYLRMLRRSLALLDEPMLEACGELRYLQIDDLIYRNLALLLCPGLERVVAEEQRTTGFASRERIFEELLEWIQANLRQPINLTVLEQRSGYSRRNLQLAFQQRFGCGPIQWIRQQRLELARQDLLHPSPGDTVAAVAARYGFSSLAVFSRDFKTVFGLRPSDLLREGRRFAP